MALDATVLKTAIRTRLSTELGYDLLQGEAGKFVDIIVEEILSHFKVAAVVNTSVVTTCPAGAGTGVGTGTIS